jgi:hypothetical protein
LNLFDFTDLVKANIRDHESLALVLRKGSPPLVERRRGEKQEEKRGDD